MKRQKPAIYTNRAADAVVQGMECIAGNGQHLSFFQVANDAAVIQLRGWLAASPLNQQILSQTAQGDRVLVVAQGSVSPEQIVAELAQHGETLAPPAKDKKFDPWKWRAATSVIGQGLQIWSSYASKSPPAERKAMFSFAALNMVANIVNWTFGAQEKRDPYQLIFLKEQLNEQLAPVLGSAALPAANDRRLDLRSTEPSQKTFGQKLYSFLERYSVTGGEIGLRVLGSAALAFPHPIKAATRLFKGLPLGDAVPTRATFLVGLTMLAGKFTSFFATEPDPFNSSVHASPMRQFREKIAFPLSSVIEGGAAVYMGQDKYRNGRIRLFNKDCDHDYLSASGNAAFVVGYAMRFKAPYGSLHVEMPELYAHISDGIAKAPRERIPELVAQTAQGLADHFKGLHTLSELYTGITTDLAKQHGIRLGDTPAVMNETHAAAAPATPTKVHAVEYQKRLVQPTAQLAVAHS